MQIIKIIRILFAGCLILTTFSNYTRGGQHGGGHHGGHHHGGRGHHARARGHGHHGGHQGRANRGYRQHRGGYGYGGYGAGYGYGNGYGSWGWNNPWVEYPWWDVNWQPGSIGDAQYEYLIPEEARQAAYKGSDYPYWGYGLGVDNELDTLAQKGKWDQIQQRLFELHNQYQQQLDHENEKDKDDQNPERIKELKDKLHKVQLHMRGLR